MQLCQVWQRSPMYWEAVNRQRRGVNQYECEGCKGLFKIRPKEFDVDHIDPKVEPSIGFIDVATYAARLNCSSKKLQVLCIEKCHRDKTNKENKERKK